MFRRCSKTFHNNYNCINHTCVIFSQYPFRDTISKKPVSHRNQSKICNANLLTGFYMTQVPTKGTPPHRSQLNRTCEKGEKLIKSLNKHVKKVLPENHLSQHACCSKKLGSFFNIKDQTKLEHNNDLTYLVKCPEKTCSENYLGETARRINERVLEHAGKDKKSHMLQHNLQSGHPSVSLNEFKILGKGFNNNRVKRKISEALLIKQYRCTLNTQENSISLELFNQGCVEAPLVGTCVIQKPVSRFALQICWLISI